MEYKNKYGTVEKIEATEITDEDMALYNRLKRHSRTLQIK